MVVDPSAVNAAVAANHLGDRCFGKGVGFRRAVSGRGLSIGLVQLVVLSIGLVDVASQLESLFVLGYRCGGSLRFSVLAGLPFDESRVCSGLPWLKTTRGIDNDLEMTGKGGTDMRWPLVGINLFNMVSMDTRLIAGSGRSALGS